MYDEAVSMDSYDKQVRIPITDEKFLKGVTIGADTSVTITGKIIELQVPREEGSEKHKYFVCGKLVLMVDKVEVKGKTDNVGEMVAEGLEMECD